MYRLTLALVSSVLLSFTISPPASSSEALYCNGVAASDSLRLNIDTTVKGNEAILSGSSGNDVVVVDLSAVELVGVDKVRLELGGGDDSVCMVSIGAVWGSSVKVELGSGNDFFSGVNGVGFTVNGASGDDIIAGANRNDVLNGGGGNDRLRGLSGNDSLIGGSGNDTMTGSKGKDVYSGGSGKNVFNLSRGETVRGLNSVKAHNVLMVKGKKFQEFKYGKRIK